MSGSKRRPVSDRIGNERYFNGSLYELFNGNYGPGGLFTKAEAQKHARAWGGNYRIIKHGQGYLLYVN